MFTLRGFIRKGLLDAVGKLADYQVILNATGWYEKGVLLEEDLVEINNKIDEKNTPVEPVEEVVEEPVEEENTVEDTENNTEEVAENEEETTLEETNEENN